MTGKLDLAQNLRNLSEIALDKWNSGLDALFYDVPALTQREVDWLWNEHLPEGAILFIDPRNDEHVGIRCTDEAGFFVACRGRGENVGVAVAIPGVGSSALGAAALGRNVADYLGQTVAVIVAGYGKSDLVADALGGWLVLEPHNQLRVLAEHLAQHPGPPATAAAASDSAAGSTEVYIRDKGKETTGQGSVPASTALSQQASLDAYANIGYRSMNMKGGGWNRRYSYLAMDTTLLSQNSAMNHSFDGLFLRAGADFHLTDKNSIGISGFSMYQKENSSNFLDYLLTKI